MTTTAARMAFRFAFVYMLLYLLPFPLHYLPGLGILVQWHDAVWQAVVPWIAAHLLGISRPLMLVETGSSDRTFDYVQILCIAVTALVVALAWAFVDHRRRDFRSLDDRLRTIVRYSLAMAMLNYGFIKVFKTQFPAPDPERLLEPYGESMPMGLMWAFMGYSYAYSLFSGIGELVGAMLLFFRRTTAAGALLLVAILANVCVLNYAYDVPAKLFSTHLLVLAIFLSPRRLRVSPARWSGPPSSPPPLRRRRYGRSAACCAPASRHWSSARPRSRASSKRDRCTGPTAMERRGRRCTACWTSRVSSGMASPSRHS